MTEAGVIGIIGFLAMFMLISLRANIALAMIIVGIIGNYFISLYQEELNFGSYLLQYKTLMWHSFASYDLSIIPMFLLLGYIANYANLSRDLFLGFNTLFGRFRGGIAIATIAACSGFGALSGSSVATASTMTKVALPWLRRFNYSDSLATGTLAAGGTLGILIPPSIILVIYAVMVEVSIIKMFQAAIVPALIAVVFFITTIKIIVWLKPNLAPVSPAEPTAIQRKNYLNLIPSLTIFICLFFGLSLGLFSPTPAAAIAVFIVTIYGLIRNVFESGLTFNNLKLAILSTAKTTGMIYFILFAAEVIKIFFSRSGLAQSFFEFSLNLNLEPVIILMMILLLLIILGCFIESLTMILIIIPYLWPVILELNGGIAITPDQASFGMSSEDLKIWFGILVLIVVELGLITPPIGLNLFVIQSLSSNSKKQSHSTSILSIFKGVLPFCLVEIIRIGLIITIPALTLFLPRILSL